MSVKQNNFMLRANSVIKQIYKKRKKNKEQFKIVFIFLTNYKFEKND